MANLRQVLNLLLSYSIWLEAAQRVVLLGFAAFEAHAKPSTRAVSRLNCDRGQVSTERYFVNSACCRVYWSLAARGADFTDSEARNVCCIMIANLPFGDTRKSLVGVIRKEAGSLDHSVMGLAGRNQV